MRPVCESGRRYEVVQLPGDRELHLLPSIDQAAAQQGTDTPVMELLCLAEAGLLNVVQTGLTLREVGRMAHPARRNAFCDTCRQMALATEVLAVEGITPDDIGATEEDLAE